MYTVAESYVHTLKNAKTQRVIHSSAWANLYVFVSAAGIGCLLMKQLLKTDYKHSQMTLYSKHEIVQNIILAPILLQCPSMIKATCRNVNELLCHCYLQSSYSNTTMQKYHSGMKKRMTAKSKGRMREYEEEKKRNGKA